MNSNEQQGNPLLRWIFCINANMFKYRYLNIQQFSCWDLFCLLGSSKSIKQTKPMSVYIIGFLHLVGI